MPYNYAQMGTGPTNQMSGVDLGGQYNTINKAVTAGRPGALDYLFRMLDSMQGVNQGNMQMDQYSQMRPYMTDQAQQGRESFQAAYPYLADPYIGARNQMNQQQEMWGMQKPYYQQKYPWMSEQLKNPYINPGLNFGGS